MTPEEQYEADKKVCIEQHQESWIEDMFSLWKGTKTCRICNIKHEPAEKIERNP